MPVVIDTHTINIRLAFLELEIEELEGLVASAVNDEAFQKYSDRLKEKRGAVTELENWIKIINQDPGWGDLVNIDGHRVPKLPTFKSPEEKAARLEMWENGGGVDTGVQELDLEQAMRAREANARNTSLESVAFLDGIGPIANETDQSEV